MQGVVRGLHVNPNGGVPKHPVDQLVVHASGCEGDKQNDRKHHGGPRKAVCLLECWVLDRLQSAGHPIQPGTTGENVLIDGTQPGDITVGVRVHIGGVVLTITGDAPPCKTIRESFLAAAFRDLSHKRHAGQTRWYASVDQPGTIRLGDDVRVINEGERVGSQ